jgi:hypothetical protein
VTIIMNAQDWTQRNEQTQGTLALIAKAIEGATSTPIVVKVPVMANRKTIAAALTASGWCFNYGEYGDRDDIFISPPVAGADYR